MKVKFGVHIEPQIGYDYENTLDIALVAEKLGYESFWCSNHLFLNEKSENQNCTFSTFNVLQIVTLKCYRK